MYILYGSSAYPTCTVEKHKLIYCTSTARIHEQNYASIKNIGVHPPKVAACSNLIYNRLLYIVGAPTGFSCSRLIHPLFPTMILSNSTLKYLAVHQPPPKKKLSVVPILACPKCKTILYVHITLLQYVYLTGRVGVSQPAKKNGRCVERREE